MDWNIVILIVSNIIIPIVVALITGVFTSKKYKKEYEHKIEILNLTHKNEIEKMKMQFEHADEMEKQKLGTNIVEKLTDKLSDEIIKQPATQKMINQRTTRNFLQKKNGRE